MKFYIFLLAGAAVLLLDHTKCVCADSSTLDHESEMASHINILHEHGHRHSGTKLQVKGGVPNVMGRHLTKSSKKCNPKKEPFRLYDTFFVGNEKRFEMCQRGCPDYILPGEFVVPGSTASKTAKECCDKYPDTSPEGYCFNIDQACVCKEQPFYYFDDSLTGYKSCVRGCEILEEAYKIYDCLPSSPTAYTTGEKCCKDNGCGTDIDGTEAFFDYCCDPKEQPFYLYSGEILGPESIDICTRVCPGTAYGLTLAQGSKASKTAKECCAKNPSTSPEGFCFDADEACYRDKQLCEKQLWYHYDFTRPDNSTVLGCGRGCSFVPDNYYRYDGVLPTSTTGYTTADECCSENECEIARDFCSTANSTSSVKDITTNPKFSALGIMTEGVGFGHAFGLMDDVDEDKGLFV